jgi:hypothetical protein
VQVRSKNLTNSLKQAVNQIATAALEAGGWQSADIAAKVSSLSCHLFRRCINTLLTATEVCGSGKVEAFKVLLQREKVWVAMFGVTAELALHYALPDEIETPIITAMATLFQGCAYEMWHMAR